MQSRHLGLVLIAICGASASQAQAPAAPPPTPPLLTAMDGTWSVQQRTWTGDGAQPTELPPAIAQRHVVGKIYLDEVMQDAGKTFARHAVVNYNAVTKRFEYASIDTRAPQLMTELGEPGADAAGELKLRGPNVFLAPEWGPAKNVQFRYRLTVSPVADKRQTVRLYLTPETVLPKKEFLAFEYVYTKQ